MIENGTLGGGASYGCEEHVAALIIVASKIEEVRRQIEADALADLVGTSEKAE